MPAHEHLQNQLFTGQGSVDAQRRKRLLAKSQQVIEDIDFAVDNKPYPKNEALEASDLKRWGPDPDPIDPAHPTIFRFKHGIHPQINGHFYRTAEQEAGDYTEYLLPYNDRSRRIDMFGSTSPDVVLKENEYNHDQDGPLHGLVQPIYQDESIEERAKKAQLYMSKEEKADARQKSSGAKYTKAEGRRRDAEILHYRLHGSD